LHGYDGHANRDHSSVEAASKRLEASLLTQLVKLRNVGFWPIPASAQPSMIGRCYSNFCRAPRDRVSVTATRQVSEVHRKRTFGTGSAGLDP